MSRLTVSTTTDFSNVVLGDVKQINFTNPVASTASAVFLTKQFGPGFGPIRADVEIDGSDGINRIVVTGNSISAARWTFGDWGSEDEVIINGTMSFDEAEGSIQSDRMSGFGGSDFLFGMAGADWISGGGGGDRISGGEGSDILLGGSGSDRLDGGGRDRHPAVQFGDHCHERHDGRRCRGLGVRAGVGQHTQRS